MPAIIFIVVMLIVICVLISRGRGQRGAVRRLRRMNADVPLLQRHRLPVLHTKEDLASALGLSLKQLTWLLDARKPDGPAGVSIHYISRTIPKSGGGERTLLVPKKRLKAVQRWILREIVGKAPLHDAAHGFRRGRSILTHATPHAGKEVVVTCDLRDFFPTMTFPRVRGVFQAMGYSFFVAGALALLCTTRLPGSRKRVLPQGAPTSPALSNLVAYRLDCRLVGLASAFGLAYTRYADDCTFSGGPQRLGALLRMVRKIIRAEQFTLHEGKLRIRRRGARQQVTGLVVNAAPAIPRAERRRLRAIVHQAQFTGLDAQNRAAHANFRDYLQGKVAFLHMVNPAQAAPLRRKLTQCLDGSMPAPSLQSDASTALREYTPGPDTLHL